MVQADPIKPTSKAPVTKRLKPECDEVLSSLAFKLNLRRYIVEDAAGGAVISLVGADFPSGVLQSVIITTPPAGAYTRPLLCST